MTNQEPDSSVYTCNHCCTILETRYHCTVCDDFDLCVSCFDKDGHSHKMEKLAFGLENESSTSDQKQLNSQETRRLSLQCDSLVHPCQCTTHKCRVPNCQKWKKIVRHLKTCKQKTHGCPVCKQFTTLCRYHSENFIHCQDTECPVSNCLCIKRELRQKKLQQKYRVPKRCLFTMQNHGMFGSTPSYSPKNSNITNKPSPSAESLLHTSPHLPQLVDGIKPSTGSAAGALHAVQQVQATAVTQTAPYIPTTAVNYVVVPPTQNPCLIVTQKQMKAEMQMPIATILVGVPSLIVVTGNVSSSNYTQIPLPHLGPQSLQTVTPGPQSEIIVPSEMPNSMGNTSTSIAPTQVMHDTSEPSLNKPCPTIESILQCFQAKPHNPHLKQQILALLKSNPQLMRAFIKNRLEQQQKQQHNVV